MNRLFSYVLRIDDGAAPNPFWGVCTLTICKPVIRKSAKIGDWVIGTGSKRVKLKNKNIVDYSDYLIYAMKITDIMTLKEYDFYCREYLLHKIPITKTDDWRLRAGDCIYDYSFGDIPALRKGPHTENERQRDLKGQNALLSSHFYYFGTNAIKLPNNLLSIKKKNQGHKKITDTTIITIFEEWICNYEKNIIHAEPQMNWIFNRK